MRRILLLFAVLLAVSAAGGENLRFASRPSLSPDGETLYFSYLGDIYTVPAAGGQALSIVSMPGQKNHPLVSPDGKWLAFSSDINGNQTEAQFTLIVEEKPVVYEPPAPAAASGGGNPYYIRINRALNTVTVYALNDAGDYEPYTAFIC